MGWDNSTIRIILLASLPFLVLVLVIIYYLGHSKGKGRPGLFAFFSLLILVPFAGTFILLALNPDANNSKNLETSFYICGNQIIPQESKPSSQLLARKATLEGSILNSYKATTLEKSLNDVGIELKDESLIIPLSPETSLNLSGPSYSPSISSTVDNTGAVPVIKIPMSGSGFCSTQPDFSPDFTEELKAYVFKINDQSKTYSWKGFALKDLKSVDFSEFDKKCIAFSYRQSSQVDPDRSCPSFLKRGLSNCLSSKTATCKISGSEYQKVDYKD